MLEHRSRRHLGASLLTAILAAGAGIAMPALAQDVAAPARKVVRTQADLPRYEYSPGTPTASALLEDDAAFDKLAEQLRRDTEATLRDYDVQDPSTLRTLNVALKNLALLRGDLDAASGYTDVIAALQDKPSAKLLSGVRDDALIAALRVQGGPEARQEAYRKTLAEALALLPANQVLVDLREWKTQSDLLSRNYILGLAREQFDPGYAKTRTLDWDTAQFLAYVRLLLRDFLPFRATQLAVLGDYLRRYASEKPEIWSVREVSLANRTSLTPVIIAIWDSGLDTSLFPGQLWSNAGEVAANGRDDDGNGYVDDVHGLGFGLYAQNYDGHALLPIPEADRPQLSQWQITTKGYFDMQAGLDTPEAVELRKRMSGAEPEQATALLENSMRYGNYAHGTHVAGIAAHGNPAVRLMNQRFQWPWQFTPPPFTPEVAEGFARYMRETVAYMRAHKVRVVNMSWRLTAVEDIEASLKANGIGGSDAERKAQAEASFKVIADALTEAMRNAPEILFVPGAGNSDDDVDFVRAVPAGIDLPNVLTAGGVDRAGDDASFTSSGRLVRIYTNGVSVESFVPGGERMMMSGTSMSAPQVVNLAGKLLALDPSLTTPQLVDLILKGGTKTADGRRLLINPKTSVALLEARGGSRARVGKP